MKREQVTGNEHCVTLIILKNILPLQEGSTTMTTFYLCCVYIFAKII